MATKLFRKHRLIVFYAQSIKNSDRIESPQNLIMYSPNNKTTNAVRKK